MTAKALVSISLGRRILDMIQYAEEQFHITITIHDRMGILAGLDHQEISKKFGHHHPFCTYERARSEKNCVRDCQQRCNEKAEKEGAPFVFDCWKGGRQVVVPVLQDGTHVATIFAGVFKGEAEALSANLSILQKDLPVLETPEKLATLMHFLAQGMQLELTEAREFAFVHGDRKAMIRRYIWLHANKSLSLAALAEHLSLSPSHASHVVSEIFGVSFQQLLLQERIRRAQGLLRTTDHSLETIAERTGFASPPYFNRQFKRIVGIPPGKFRALSRSNVDGTSLS